MASLNTTAIAQARSVVPAAVSLKPAHVKHVTIYDRHTAPRLHWMDIIKHSSFIVLSSTFISAYPSVARADQLPVEQTFSNTCAGCHAGGGNIVRRDATLKSSDLKKYGVDSPDALYQLIYSGRGSMPGYGEDCAPKKNCTFGKRLSDSEIQSLASFVLDQSSKNWSE